MTLEERGGQLILHGHVLERITVALAARSVEIFGLADAADLLDHPEVARRFEDHDLAPYGAQLWPAAVMLAEHLCAAPPGGGRPALELGCGVGLVAIAAAISDWQVTATDEDPAAVELARHNARHNRVRVNVARLDWRQPPRGAAWPMILASDVLYERADHAALLRCLRALLAPAGEALLADPDRAAARPFPELAARAGFTVAITPLCTAAFGPTRLGRLLHLRLPP